MPADALLAQARAWLADDPDPATRAELADLLRRAVAGDEAADADLADRFAGPLEFGTAGLRAAMGAGPRRMNRVVVQRAAAGLAAYLTSRHPAETGALRVVIGYDARHSSADFARDTAAVITGAGLQALLLPAPLPTPVLAFAVRRLRCAAGVMVTASHNPAQDNGYKVYLGDGCQIVPPADADIAAAIAAVGPPGAVPRGTGWQVLGPQLLQDYLDAAASVACAGTPRDVRIVLTPLHGVGGEVAVQALRRAGFGPVQLVAEQARPDPDFPTVAYPNPEEAGALDLAVAAARAAGADLVIANDPDADRCAVAVPDPVSPEAGATGVRRGDRSGRGDRGRMLHGDELGALLGDHLVRRGLPAGSVLASSVVSGSLLARIAAAAALPHVQTLTGFKWIARVPGLAYGYEEALGYCVDPASVRDKDGVSAAVLAAELAASAKAAGTTLPGLLDDLARRHGLHLSDQLSVRLSDPAAIARVMARLRSAPPHRLAGAPVTSADDLAPGLGPLPPPTRCATAPTGRTASWSVPAAPSRSSSATSRWWRRSWTATPPLPAGGLPQG